MGHGGRKVEEVQRLFLHHSSILRGFVLGLLPPQIAARLSWTVDAVHVALARVRKFLRECVQRKVAARGT